MARAYIVTARNDLADGKLQILDLKPNASQKSAIYEGTAQTHYSGYMPTHDPVVLDDSDFDGDHYGLNAYLIDNISSDEGVITATNANDIASDIFSAVSSGLPLTAAAVDAILVDQLGEGNGLALNDSTASLSDILRILAGEVWKAPDGTAVSPDGDAFAEGVVGYFVTRPNVELPESVRSPQGYPVRGRSFLSRAIPVSTPTLSTGQDFRFRDQPVILDLGALQLSALSGALSKLASPDFTHKNPKYTYGTNGTAKNLAGDSLPISGKGRALTVYDASGNVIV